MRHIFTAIMLLYACSLRNGLLESPEIKLVVTEKDSATAAPPEVDPEEISEKYDSLKTAIENKRQKLSAKYAAAITGSLRKAVIRKARDYLLKTLSEELFPLWYGTTWDFNGTTETPLQGEIACGYFVSTTLKHTGFELQRYKLAQQCSSNIVKTLCSRSSIKRIGNNDIDKMLGYVNQQGKGLYIVGLDYHVGFILKSEEGVFFIHSTFLEPMAVLSEKADESEALLMSDAFVIGNLLENEALIIKWLTSGYIPTASN